MDTFNPPDDKVKEAMRMEGYLSKQSPGAVITTFQTRYFKFIDKGLTLAYAAKPEHFEKDKIKGKIPLKYVIAVQETPTSVKRFDVIVEGRVYKLEAKTEQDRAKWISCLQTTVEYAQALEVKGRETIKALDQDIKFEDDAHDEEEEEKRAKKRDFNVLKPLDFITGTAKKVVTGGAGTVVKVIKSGVQKLEEFVCEEQTHLNEDYLAKKGMLEYFSQIDPKILDSRLIMGQLLREKQRATGNSLLDSLANGTGLRELLSKRWCLLVSQRPIVFDNVDPDDEKLLEASKLPLDMEFNVLYVYDDECDDSKPLHKYPMENVLEIVVKMKSPKEPLYKFCVDTGEQKLFFLTPDVNIQERWLKAIQSSRSYVKEHQKSRFPIVKNMFWNYKIFQEKGKEAMIEKAQADYEKLTSSDQLMREANTADLLKVLRVVGYEYLQIVNACLVHKDDKVPIIQIYAKEYHENILSSLHNYYEKNFDNLQNKDFMDIIDFLDAYNEELKTYGASIEDDRIIDGIRALSSVIAKRILQSNKKTCNNILFREAQIEPVLDARGRFATEAPNDMFKIISETLNILTICNNSEFCIAVFDTCMKTFHYFINGINQYVLHGDLNIDQIAGMCNNSVSFVAKLKEFKNNAAKIIKSKPQTLEKLISDDNLSRVFVNTGRRGLDKLCELVFKGLHSKWQAQNFLEVNMKVDVQKCMETMRQIQSKVHPNFVGKIDHYCLERIVAYYIQTFTINAEKKKLKKELSNQIKSKFSGDVSYLKLIYNHVKEGELLRIIQPMSEYEDFLDKNYEFLPFAVQGMKELYGQDIKWSTMEALLKLRDPDIPKEERMDIFKSCKQMFEETEKKQETKAYNVFRKMQQISIAGERDEDCGLDSDSSEDEEDLKDFFEGGSASDSSINRLSKLDSTLNFSDELGQMIDKKMTYEGYLDIPKGIVGNISILRELKYDLKYFAIRKHFMYVYENKKAEKAQKNYDLKNAEDLQKIEQLGFSFKLRKPGESTAAEKKFKADTEEKRDIWFTVLQNVIDKDWTVGLKGLEDVDDLYDEEIILFDDEKEPEPDLAFVEKLYQPVRVQQPPPTEETKQATTAAKRRKSFDINDDVQSIQKNQKAADAKTKKKIPDHYREERGISCMTCMFAPFMKKKNTTAKITEREPRDSETVGSSLYTSAASLQNDTSLLESTYSAKPSSEFKKKKKKKKKGKKSKKDRASTEPKEEVPDSLQETSGTFLRNSYLD